MALFDYAFTSCLSKTRHISSIISASSSKKLLESCRLFLQCIEALIQARVIIVAWRLDEQMILQHLLSHKFRKKRFIHLRGDLVERKALASGFLEVRHNTIDGVIVGGGQDLLSVEQLGVLKGRLDEFSLFDVNVRTLRSDERHTCIFLGVKEGEFGIFAHW